MKFQKRRGLSSQDIRILLLIGIVALIVVSMLIGVNLGLSRIVRGGGGFFVAWQGARGLLLEIIDKLASFVKNPFLNFGQGSAASATAPLGQADPYSVSVAVQTQQMVYGRAAQPGENPYFLTIPFFLLPFYFPFALIPDPAIARGIWMSLCEVALVAAAILSLRMIEWRPPRFLLILFILLSLFTFYSVDSLLEGSPIILLTLLFVGILYTYVTQQDELTGALLVFSLFYWEVGLPFVLLMFLKIFMDKRSRVLNGFGMLLLILGILSFLIYPGWLLSFITATIGAIRSSFGITTSAVFARLSPSNGNLIAQVVTIFVIIMLVYEWLAARTPDPRHFIWTACLTLAATPLIGFRTDMNNLVVLFPALALILAATVNRWRAGNWLALLLLLIVLLLPWGFFVRWFLLHEQRSWDYLFLFFPAFTILSLYWTRWWFIRPPRTWLDHVRANPG